MPLKLVRLEFLEEALFDELGSLGGASPRLGVEKTRPSGPDRTNTELDWLKSCVRADCSDEALDGV